MVRRCYVPDCFSEEGKEEHQGVTFHKIPMHPDIRPKWMSLCHIPDDKKNMKVIYVCSRHFLSADFCHFKGKKYMLRQGVLPSVFPWKKAVKKSKVKKEGSLSETVNCENKTFMDTSFQNDSNMSVNFEGESSKSLLETDTIKKADKMEQTKTESIKDPEKCGLISENVNDLNLEEEKLKTFAPNMRIEALDFNEMWYPAQVVEVDYEENEVLVHFEKYSSKYDEWICMNSSRLRPLMKKKVDVETFSVGEKCMALWNDSRRFPATVTKVIDNDTYEVIFDDGFVKVLKAHRMTKTDGKNVQTSSLFDPIQGTKQERRDKKRKLNVAALFGKRSRIDTTAGDNGSQGDEIGSWMPKWENGRPVGVESMIELNDGARKSVIVPDPRLPSNWVKHLTQRVHGTSAGKWDTVIVSPEGKRFRTRAEVKAYIDAHPELNLSESMFDFSLHKKTRKSTCEANCPQIGQGSENCLISEDLESCNEEDNPSSLKIPLVDSAYKCPIEGCGKNFRRENLAQMHVKHYHPEYTKFLDSTPNVADLAYARTVGENLEKGAEKIKAATGKYQTPKSVSPRTVYSVHKNLQPQPFESSTVRQQKQLQPSQHKHPHEQEEVPEKEEQESKAADSEIVRLLNTKPSASNVCLKYPPGLPSSAYPDIKLKDLLKKSEGIPKRDDLNLKTLSASTVRPTGIKTLLPVNRPEVNREEENISCTQNFDQNENNFNNSTNFLHTKQAKRKCRVSESSQELKEVTDSKTDISQKEQFNYIVEGGEVIKIVQMKREEIINCTCGITEEDGLMIQCELCLCWQHAYCNNIEKENQVPDKYICYICQNPSKQRSSRKYYHDQDWLKHGVLAVGTYHCKDEETLSKRFEKLKKSHDLSGALIELKDFTHTLRTKIKIAEAKNHPKLYLWSKIWGKSVSQEELDKKDSTRLIKQEIGSVESESLKNNLGLLNEKSEIPCGSENSSMLFSLLRNTKDDKEEHKLKEELDLNAFIDNNINTISIANSPMIPQPEAAIDSSECRLNLLDHVAYSQNLVEKRLDNFEEKIKLLEDMDDENDENFVRTRHTLEMLLRDLVTLQDFGQSSSL